MNRCREGDRYRMGLERLCMAVQGKLSNYDTDLFQPLIQKMEITGCPYGKNDKQDVAMRVVADHVRTIAFSITDGQLPSSAKRVTRSGASCVARCGTATPS